MRQVVGCFLEHDGTFLLLRRHPAKIAGNKWGLPAGSVEPGETDLQAMIRELFEETGYRAGPGELEQVDVLELADSAYGPLHFTSYRLRLAAPHEVALAPAEHTEHRWFTPEDAVAHPDQIEHLSTIMRRIGYLTDRPESA